MKMITLTKGRFAIVDDEDYAILSRHGWHLKEDRSGITCYANAKIGGKKVLMHRLILDAKPGQIVDHIDGDGLNNQKTNLRLCDAAQNVWNRRLVTGKSRFIGVSFDTASRKWEACIRHRGRSFKIGRFADEIEAAIAYDAACQILRGEFAVLNGV